MAHLKCSTQNPGGCLHNSAPPTHVTLAPIASIPREDLRLNILDTARACDTALSHRLGVSWLTKMCACVHAGAERT